MARRAESDFKSLPSFFFVFVEAHSVFLEDVGIRDVLKERGSIP